MTHPAPDSESLEDFVARISDVLRFVFAQDRNDVVVLVGEIEPNRELQLPAAPPVLVAESNAMDDIVGGRTRINPGYTLRTAPTHCHFAARPARLMASALSIESASNSLRKVSPGK
jgi:hypothetical protein